MTLPRLALAGGAIIALTLVIYAAFGPGANRQTGSGADVSSLEALRVGDMKKLVFHAEPRDAVMTAFLNADGAQTNISAYAGKTVLVNFWATWCAPCRAEMPALDALQRELGGEKFEVVTIATGRNPPRKIDVFFEMVGVRNLPKARDPTQALTRDMSVFGLPTTVLLNHAGQEIARMRGDAAWDRPEAVALLRAVIGE